MVMFVFGAVVVAVGAAFGFDVHWLGVAVLGVLLGLRMTTAAAFSIATVPNPARRSERWDGAGPDDRGSPVSADGERPGCRCVSVGRRRSPDAARGWRYIGSRARPSTWSGLAPGPSSRKDSALRRVAPVPGRSTNLGATGGRNVARAATKAPQRSAKRRKPCVCRASSCAEEDSNLHPVSLDQALNLARLPIPPSARGLAQYSRGARPNPGHSTNCSASSPSGSRAYSSR